MKKQKNNLAKITTLFGFALFALYLVSIIFNTIMPWTSVFSVPTAKHFNIAVFTLSLVAGAILPTLLAYFIGNRATHKNDKQTRRFNGIAFGIAAYWWALLFSYIGADTIGAIRNSISEPWAFAVSSGWQIVATVGIVTIVALLFTRQKSNSVVEYRPYQIVLTASAILPSVYALLHTQDSNMLMNIFVPFGIPVILAVTSYVALSKVGLSKSARFTMSITSISVAFITAHITSTLLSTIIPTYDSLLLVTTIIGVIIMSAYLLLLRRN